MKYGFFAFVAIALLISSCGEKKKKKSINTNGEVTIEEFMDAYQNIKLPFTLSDTSFPKKETDSSLIAQDIFYKFIPDSALNSFFGSNKPKYYSVGRFNNGEEETYLITRGVTKDKKIFLLTAYDKSKKFIANLPLIRSDKSTYASSVVITIDPKFNINKNITKKLSDGSVVQGNDVYILNASSKKFMLVMTDSLGEASSELINPIDTLPRTNKYAGDYGDGKQNLISFRDGKREGKMHLFVHLMNEKDGCSGELKGEVTFINPTTAEYRQGGDPCVLQFIFNKSGVQVREVEGCGSRLGTLQCTFNGNYPNQKPTKISTENSKKEPAKPKKSKK